MTGYQFPSIPQTNAVSANEIVLVASGDLRASANVTCWPAQQALEENIKSAFATLGKSIKRAHGEAATDLGQHGFIDSQKRGIEIFANIDPDAPLVVAEAVWQYSHHVLAGLVNHRGPILLLANWSGQWPGLVGVLNLRGSLTKAGREYSILWAEDFTDPACIDKLRVWCETGSIPHDTNHVRPLPTASLPESERELGVALAEELRRVPAIMGVFDEGCMGMFNAIIPDHLLHACGVFKERLSQSALYYAMTEVPDAEAQEIREWYDEQGVTFVTGEDESADLTDRQILDQCKMYIAAARLADEFGCEAIGIQYQQGLKDLAPASDLVEGTLNCSVRPPVTGVQGGVIRDGEPITHFNEVDECAGLDAIITNRVWRAMGMTPDNTLHDVRWGDPDRSGTTHEYVWVFEISGSVPPSHFANGWADAVSERQPPMYFRLGGGTLKGVSKPGECVWSRIFVAGDRLHIDIGRCKAIELPEEETHRRLDSTTSQWPIMHAVTYGVSRDQLMARHQANHIQVVYADTAEHADRALAAKASMADRLGITVHLCGDDASGQPLAEAMAHLENVGARAGGGRTRLR